MSNEQKTIHFLADFQLSKATTKGERTFSGVAYAGGVITDHSWYNAVAFDLDTTSAATPLPLLFNHGGSPIGVIETVTIGTNIEIAGRLFADIDPVAKDIADKSDRGIHWQLSVGIFPASTEHLNGTAPHLINGQQFTGDVTLLKQNRIREVSFVTLGADDKTAATVFNSSPKPTQESSSMTLTAEQAKALQDENAVLKSTSGELQLKLTAMETELKKQFTAARVEQVKALFTATKREYNEAAGAAYMDLTTEQFAAISSDMVAQSNVANPNLPAHLFDTQAKDGMAPANEKTHDFSTVYTDRNAQGKK